MAYKFENGTVAGEPLTERERMMLEALEFVAEGDPVGWGCEPQCCKCMGCVARRAIAAVEPSSRAL